MPNKRVSVKGKGAELFFGELTEAPALLEAPSEISSQVATKNVSLAAEPSTPTTPPPTARSATSKPNSRGSRSSSKSAPTTSHSSNGHASPPLPAEMLDDIQRILTHSGKEVSYVRLSADEKDRVAEVVYSYRRQGFRVSETEIHRIAINYLLADYDHQGNASVLARMLARLKAI